MQLKEKKAKRKVNKVNVAAIIVSIIALLGLVCLCAGVGTIIFLLKDKPELDLNDFNTQESSIVYDKDDNQIYELGTVIRQNIEYEDIPNSLIDAFVAVEDSRYFEHAGFDVPRFAKALISNIKTMSFAQGGSTFTMQLVKNTYFTSDDEGHGAVKSIKRKVQEIALALQLEQKSSKKEIFTNYLNKLNFGGTNQNIRGVQKAAQYYFGKDVNELNLEESAMLAGVVNSPYTFNPYINLDYAQDRRDEVLYLMNYHGYITDTEYKQALGTNVEDFLVGTSSNNERGSGNGTPYQAYIDYVVEEVYNLTGLDPYTTSMRIHTCMDKDVQELMDSIQAGNVDDYFEYPNDEFEVASLCLRNDTGEIIGILGGRNYADGGALLLNHATDQYKQPGSSIKPILDYVQAFEVLGWSTSHVIVDKPLVYQGTNYIISNSTNNYAGEITLKYALGMSLNTPAIQTIRELIDKKGNTYLVDYLTSMGFNIDLNDFDEQYGIGGKGLNVSCLQLAGAYAALMNDGYYTTPHTIKKIEFLNEKAPITPSYQPIQTVSEQACYLMSELLKSNVEGGYPNLMGLFRNDNYKVYAKTGTSNWGSEGAAYDIPNGSIKDGWVVACTSDYSVATWMGYEKAQVGKPSYMPYDIYNKNIKGKISKLILDKTADKFGYADEIQRPSGITSITHIAKSGTPYVAPIEGISEEYLTTGLIKSDSPLASLASPQKATISELSENPTVSLSGTMLTIKWPTYPDKNLLTTAEDTMDLPLLKTDGEVLYSAKGNRMFDYTWVFGTVKYKADISVAGKTIKSIASSDSETIIDLAAETLISNKLTACAYYGYENANVNSASKCVEVDINDTVTINVPNSDDVDTLVSALSKYANVEVEYKPATSEHSEGIIRIFKYEPSETEITSYIGSSFEARSFKLSKFVIIKYTGVEYTVHLNKSEPSNNKITITASVSSTDSKAYDSEGYKWYVNEAEQSTKTSSITVDIPSTGSIEVTVKLNDGTSDTITISAS